MPHDTAQICENGHLVNSYSKKYPSDNESFCSKCGALTITKCPYCNQDIRGHDIGEYGFVSAYEKPMYCINCGNPYPWTVFALRNTALLITEDAQLGEHQINELINNLPDIITETPSTNLAIARMKKALLSVGKITAEGIRQFVIDFGCELAKKSLGF